MKKSEIYLTIILILISSFAIRAQMLAPQYSFQREVAATDGKTLFVLNANPEYGVIKMNKGEGFSVIGAIIEPENEHYTLLFVHAARTINFQGAAASLTLDGERIVFPKFGVKMMSPINEMQMQMVGININREIFEKMRDAKSATFAIGAVTFPFAQDDFNALDYLTKRVETRELAPEYMLYSDKDEQTGIPYQTLNADPDIIRAHAEKGEPTTLLVATAQPKLNRAFVMLVNCREKLLTEAKMLIEIDGEPLPPLPLISMPSRSLYNLKMQIASAEISLEVLKRLTHAKAVKVTIGDFTYTLTEDNLDALKYFDKKVFATSAANQNSIKSPAGN